MSDQDLRGSAPIFTAKDVLIEVRDEVRGMKTAVDVLVSQNLNQRVDDLERSRDELKGLSRISMVIATGAGLGSIIVAILTLA